MTDRELLEMAAKAAGIVIVSPVERYIVQPLPGHVDGFIIENDRGGHSPWNPLGDDGDALRLAVKLGFDFAHDMHNRRVYCESEELAYDETKFGGESDPYAATRRAVVRAAAEIGKEADK